MNPESYIVVYSNGGECPFAAEAAKRLEDLKLRNVHLYEGGLQEWREADLPVIPSPNAKLHTQGPVEEVRHVDVDTETAYGGAFKDKSYETEGSAGG
jgi:3-mercaptopyruvate sulfurtransferase SseA